GEVAVLLASGAVMLVSERGSRALPMPAPTTWDRPPPRDEKGNVATGAEPRSDKQHLFVSGGEVWLAKCPWGFLFDAGGCHEWVSVRLAPSPAVKVGKGDPPGFRDQPTPRFDAAEMPAGVSLTVDGARLVCQRGGAKGVYVPELAEPKPDLSW